MIDLVVFDCDGVLVDSEVISNRILAELLSGLGLATTTEDSIARYMGRSMASVMADVEERLGRPPPADLVARRDAAMFPAFEAELQAVVGIHDALEQLDVPVCVASSGTHEKLRFTLAHTGLLERFEGRIFSAYEVEHGKPAPDLFLHAAERMGARPERCLVVEDSPAGVAAGRAARMVVLGYAAFTPAAELEDAGADETFAAMADLPGLVRGYAARA